MEEYYRNNSITPMQEQKMRDFLERYSPEKIERALNQYIIGQSELTRAVADFLYYHALRQLHPELPQRPLLISGPSGSGKTEVWRAAGKLYQKWFPIRVADGSNLSCNGWAGNYKINTFVTTDIAWGGILVVDEFDKLTKPKYSSSNTNVSIEMQAEFLKLLEGEHHIMDGKQTTGITTRQMGFVMVGAFESLRARKEAEAEPPARTIGFCQAEEPRAKPISMTLTDEDFIAYGVMPELVGRIAEKCSTRELTTEGYIKIIKNPHSRVGMITQILKQHGVDVSDVISDEALRKLIATSRNNKTGVRWVSAQIERNLLEKIRKGGLPRQKYRSYA